MRMNDGRLHTTISMNLINMTLSERNQPQEKRHVVFFHLYKVQKLAELIYAARRQEND